MSILEGVLKEELQRQQSNIVAYAEKLSELPKGYLYIQCVNGRRYCYRKWREGNKVLSSYIGEAESEEAEKAKRQYEERKRIAANLRELKKEEQRLKKALRHYAD